MTTTTTSGFSNGVSTIVYDPFPHRNPVLEPVWTGKALTLFPLPLNLFRFEWFDLGAFVCCIESGHTYTQGKHFANVTNNAVQVV